MPPVIISIIIIHTNMYQLVVKSIEVVKHMYSGISSSSRKRSYVVAVAIHR